MDAMHEFDLGPDYSDGPEGPDRSLLAHCLDLLDQSLMGEDPGCVALEFGTGSGETTRMIAATIPVISFDSFQGLPEDWRPDFRKGRFGSQTMPTDIPGATIVPGWFSDTLPDYDWDGLDVRFVHFDADLYSSTMTALDAMGHLLEPGVICVFDEFHGFDDDFKGTLPGEQQAWAEFVAANSIDYAVIGHGREQWACVIR